MLMLMAVSEESRVLLNELREVNKDHIKAVNDFVETFTAPPYKVMFRAIKEEFSRKK